MPVMACDTCRHKYLTDNAPAKNNNNNAYDADDVAR